MKLIVNATSNDDVNKNYETLKSHLGKKIDFFIGGIEGAHGVLEFETSSASSGALSAIVFLRKLKKCLPECYGTMVFCVESLQRDHSEGKRSIEKMVMSRERIYHMTEFITAPMAGGY